MHHTPYEFLQRKIPTMREGENLRFDQDEDGRVLWLLMILSPSS
jgi:hypothetical protein